MRLKMFKFNLFTVFILFQVLVSIKVNCGDVLVKTEANPCGSNEWFMCKTSRVCIAWYNQCNFHDDCGDNSDEQDCGTCSFDKTDLNGKVSMCGWTNTGEGQKKWSVVSASNISARHNQLPNQDAIGNRNGNYLILESVAQGDTSDAVIKTPRFGKTGPGCKMNFYFGHYYPQQTFPPMHVWIESGDSPRFLLPLMDFSEFVTWKQYSVDIGHQEKGFQIELRANGTEYAPIKPFMDMRLDQVEFVDCDPNSSPITAKPTTPEPVTKPTQLPSTVKPNPCGKLFQCKNSDKCLADDKVCDFHDDCGDGSDEQICGTCNFEGNSESDGKPSMCGWENFGIGGGAIEVRKKWELVSANISSKYHGNLPQVDSKENKNGHYLIIRSDGNQDAAPAQIGTPYLGQSASSCKMTFYLEHLNPRYSSPPINIDIISGDYPRFQMYLTQFNDTLTHWKKYTVNIGKREKNFQIAFRAGGTESPGLGPYNDMALDDIQFIDCDPKAPPITTPTESPSTVTPNPCGELFQCKKTKKCLEDDKVCDFHDDCGDGSDEQVCGTCNFEGNSESDGKPSMCGWDNFGIGGGAIEVRKKWSLVSANISAKYNGHLPSQDSKGNKNGHYVIIQSDGNRNAEPAQIRTPYLGVSASSCKMTFYLEHLYPRQTNPPMNINIITGDSPRFLMALTSFNETFTSWKKYTVNIGKREKYFQISFRAGGTESAELGPYNDMALDDIQFIDCDPNPPTPVLSCNFESGTLCDWKNDPSDYPWSVTYPGAVKLNSTIGKIMPRSDHTLGNRLGHFAYLSHENIDANSERTAVMTVEDKGEAVSGGPVCLTLWYYMRTSAEVELKVSVKGKDNSDEQLIIKRNDHGDKWNKLQMEARDVKNGYVFTINALAKIGVVAIDDINVEHKLCERN